MGPGGEPEFNGTLQMGSKSQLQPSLETSGPPLSAHGAHGVPPPTSTHGVLWAHLSSYRKEACYLGQGRTQGSQAPTGPTPSHP